jgi:hypothetical protein
MEKARRTHPEPLDIVGRKMKYNTIRGKIGGKAPDDFFFRRKNDFVDHQNTSLGKITEEEVTEERIS